MTTTYLEAPGSPLDAEALQVAKAQELVRALRSEHLAFATFVESRREDQGVEVVVIDVEVERGQHVEHAIEFNELVAVRFFPEDERIPEVLALRANFPEVPHLNLRTQHLPRSLCLYDISYDEVKLSWTAVRFVERIRTWLAQTARGELHADDQPLEPLIVGAAAWLVLPVELNELVRASGPARLLITGVSTSTGQITYLARDANDPRHHTGRQCVATVIVGEPQPHGIIRRQPETLQDLHAYLLDAGIDLIAVLRERLRLWQEAGEAQTLLNHHLILIILLPKTRTASGAVEASDIYAFLGLTVLGYIGDLLGVWALHKEHLGAVLLPIVQADQVRLSLLNPTFAMSREWAALLTGRTDTAPRSIAAIGVGALGSQVITNLLRAGYGPWAVIDNDIMLPHNLGRHALHGWAVGQAKADALALSAQITLNEPDLVIPIVADVLHPGERMHVVTQALGSASAILDMSASVAVARALASDMPAAARRISVFLSPSGQDLVLLAEDELRAVPLDLLEMQYYRLLIQNAVLHEHLRTPHPGRRYARSCRDVSATIPQELVALHAAIGSQAVRTALDDTAARITIWQADPTIAISPGS